MHVAMAVSPTAYLDPPRASTTRPAIDKVEHHDPNMRRDAANFQPTRLPQLNTSTRKADRRG
jgi:hypothetical protein